MKKLRKLLLEKLDVPMEQFCKEAGVNRETISQIINGKYNHSPRLLTIKKICKYFNVDPVEYIEEVF